MSLTTSSTAVDSKDDLKSLTMTSIANQYPNFLDGNVLIVSPTGNKSWKLHSDMLRNTSDVFRLLIDGQPPVKYKYPADSAEVHIQWKFRMVPQADDRFVKFVPVDPNNDKPIIPTQVGGNEPKFHSTYDVLFRMMYNLESPMSHAAGDADGILDCIAVLSCSEKLAATPAVRAPIETAFLRLGDEFYEFIQMAPEPWGELGIRIRSPIIFREALIHLVGTWYHPGGLRDKDVSKLAHGDMVKALVRRKVRDLDSKKIAIESTLLNFFPPSMSHHPRNGMNPNRHTYAADIYKWQALTLIRQYLTKAMCERRGRLGPDRGFAFFKAIGEGGDAYLRRHEIEGHFDNCYMNTKGRNAFCGVLDRLKEEYKPIVWELVKENTRCNAEVKASLDYLTCAEVDDDEMPWITNPDDVIYD